MLQQKRSFIPNCYGFEISVEEANENTSFKQRSTSNNVAVMRVHKRQSLLIKKAPKSFFSHLYYWQSKVVILVACKHSVTGAWPVSLQQQ